MPDEIPQWIKDAAESICKNHIGDYGDCDSFEAIIADHYRRAHRCPTCDGTGKVHTQYGGRYQCSMCRGKGLVIPEVSK